jgi:hypothetical protein
MKIYYAGIAANVERLRLLRKFGGKRLMLTFADKHLYTKNMQRFKDQSFDIMLDSGAFSVLNSGKKICAWRYADYILEHNINSYINLDVIGDVKETQFNQNLLEDMGLNPIPVFHYGCSLEYLSDMCSEYPYICLGGTVGKKKMVKKMFFGSIFRRFPNHKFHGLGVNDFEVMRSYDFFSVDSTSWLIGPKFKRVFDKKGFQVQAQDSDTEETMIGNTVSLISGFDI